MTQTKTRAEDIEVMVNSMELTFRIDYNYIKKWLNYWSIIADVERLQRIIFLGEHGFDFHTSIKKSYSDTTMNLSILKSKNNGTRPNGQHYSRTGHFRT